MYSRIVLALVLFFTIQSWLFRAMAGDYSIHFVTPRIVHVQWSPNDSLEENNTGVIVPTALNYIKVKTKNTPEVSSYSSSEITVVHDKESGSLSFKDYRGNLLLRMDGRSLWSEPSVQEKVIYDEKSAHVEETANGKVTVRDVLRRDTIGVSTRFSTTFMSPFEEEGVYGLGAHMEDYLNLRGKTLYLTQHNLKAMVPMFLSTRGYGLLFDAGCAMVYKSQPRESDSTPEKGYQYTFQLEAAKSLDYYFILGSNLDDILSDYHHLTGNVSMMPRYLFGYTQSKERYCSSDEIVSVLKEYRRRQIPIDMIVQDWNYWPQGWGYMKMDPKYYPSPRALADSVHALHAKLMVSIWPNPQWCPEADDFKQRGMMLPHDVYDVFNPEARRHYWQYVNDEFFSQGFDAWWCDSSEPLDGDWNRIPATTPQGEPYGWDSHAYRWQLNKNVLSESLGAERSSLYSFYHSKGIYENQLLTDPTRRVVNLTRSSYAGQQRFGTIVWNGDTHASWASFRQQIPAGLNYMATGNPYWTVDVGSFFTRNDGRRWFYKGEFPRGVQDDEYKEYYTRMFQWATFLPMLRSHGSDTPREIWQFGEPGTPYYEAIRSMIQLRYQHIPYIYSMAANISGRHGSLSIFDFQHFRRYRAMARLLAFDFPNDTTVYDLKDEYMFGDYLVCPVTHPMREQNSRAVYLPQGTSWYDYWTGQLYEGGQWLEVAVDISRLPLYVRAGSIITTTQVTQYSDAQQGLPVTIHIYPGSTVKTFLYEDAGDGNDHRYATIALYWDESKHSLTLCSREGSYPGMPESRTFIIRTVDGTERTVTYTGRSMKIKL